MSTTTVNVSCPFNHLRPGRSRQEAAELVLRINQLVESGMPVCQAARTVGMPESSYYSWRSRLRIPRPENPYYTRHEPAQRAPGDNLAAENARLREIVIELTLRLHGGRQAG